MMDFDRKVQERIRELADAVRFKRPEWHEWFHLSAEEFEELARKNTNRSFDEVPKTTTNPASFALKSLEGVENSVILHTSGIRKSKALPSQPGYAREKLDAGYVCDFQLSRA